MIFLDAFENDSEYIAKSTVTLEGEGVAFFEGFAGKPPTFFSVLKRISRYKEYLQTDHRTRGIH